MAKYTVIDPSSVPKQTVSSRSSTLPLQAVPTYDIRHSSWIREGRQSGEAWSAAQKAEWHEEYDGPEAKPANVKKLKEAVDASKELQQGSEESSQTDAKAVRDKTRDKHLLRKGKSAGSGKDNAGKDQQRLQQRRKNRIKAAKAKKKEVE